MIKIEDLYVEYNVNKGAFGAKQVIHAVNGVSLDIQKGEILALAGESGCGKSTLAKAILRLEPVKSGQIICDAKDFRKFAQMIFQNPYASLNPKMKILDILKEENVKATFFVVGKHVKENPDLVKREYEEGHYIANHGYNHNNKLLYRDMESFQKEVENTDLEIANALGLSHYCSHIFRFPNGYMSHKYQYEKKNALQVLSDLDYVYVDWNCLNRDSEKKYSDSQLLNNLKKTAKNKGTLIILMHDTADVNKTYNVLKSSIDYLKSEGYEFRNFYDFVNLK